MRNKRILPIIAFLLCIVTLLPALPLVASAWTDADMHSGFIGNSISYQGGAGGSYNGGTYPPSYDLEAIIGYRFTCWRSTDYQDNANKKLSPTEYVNVLAGHTENGYKLGHSINILVNSRLRQDYANAANQTIDNQSAPRLYMNAAQKDYLDKITLAQSEIKTNSNTKVTHSTDVSLGMIDYAGNDSGYLTSKSGPTVTFKKPIYTKMDKKEQHPDNSILNDAFVGISNTKPLTLYTGYTMHDLETKAKLNGGKNLYTFIYGERYTDMTGTSKSSIDYSKNVTTISDIDHKDSLPFNCNPNNILDKSNPNSWLNLNAGLVATLCGLDPTPGKVAYDYATKKADDTKFGLYDYIIVEPIFMAYHSGDRLFLTASDSGLVHAEALADKFRPTNGNPLATNCYSAVYVSNSNSNGKSKWCTTAGWFGMFASTAFATDKYFGVSGVYNGISYGGLRGAQGSHPLVTGYKYTGGFAPDYSMTSTVQNYAIKNVQGKSVKVTAPHYAAVVVHDYIVNGVYSSAFTQIISENGRGQINTPQVMIETMAGAGVWFSGDEGGDSVAQEVYRITYHSNYNSTASSTSNRIVNQDFVGSEFETASNKFALYTYTQAGFALTTKSATGVWTVKTAAKDNQLGTFAGQKYNEGTILTASEMKTLFKTYGTTNGNVTTVHLYAAWSTQTLITAIDRICPTHPNNTCQCAIPNSATAVAITKYAYPKSTTDTKYITDIAAVSSYSASNGSYTVGGVVTFKVNSNLYQWTPASQVAKNSYIIYATSGTLNSKSEIEKALKNGQAKKYSVQWSNTSNTPVFVVDFFSYSIQANGCSITFNHDGKTTSAKNFYNTAVAYGAKAGYSISVTESNQAIGSWTKTIHASNASNKTPNNVVMCNTAAPDSLTYTNYANPPTTVSHNIITITGKNEHVVTLQNTTVNLTIQPWIDEVAKDPFEGYTSQGYYSVKIYDHTAGSEVSYSTNPATHNIKRITGALSSLTVSVVKKHKYTISVSYSSPSGFNSMYSTQITVGANDTDITMAVKYKSASVRMKTIAKVDNKWEPHANHSGSGATIAQLTPSGTPIASVYSDSVAISTQCPVCASAKVYSDTKMAFLQGITIEQSGQETNLQNLSYIQIARDEVANWQKQNIKKVVSGSEKDVTHSESEGVYQVLSLDGKDQFQVSTHVVYYLEPIHQVTFLVNDAQVAPNTFIANADTTITSLQYTTANLQNLSIPHFQFVSAKGSPKKYTQSVPSTLYSYFMPANIYLRYYTVDIAADEGYTNDVYVREAGNNAWQATNKTPVYVYSSATSTQNYVSCANRNNNSKYTDIYVEHESDKRYETSCALLADHAFENVAMAGKLTATAKGTNTQVNGEVFLTDVETCTIGDYQGYFVGFSKVTEESEVLFTSRQATSDITIVFRINGVPYDSLPETINNQVSINGRYALTMGITRDPNNPKNYAVVATGAAPIGSSQTIWLNGCSSGNTINVSENPAENVFYVDYYTYRVSAGTGVGNVSIQLVDQNDEPIDDTTFSGALTYMRDGNVAYDTIAISPLSLDSQGFAIQLTAPFKMEQSEITTYWQVKRGHADLANCAKVSTKHPRQILIINDFNSIRGPVVVQCELSAKGSTIELPTIVEHNSYYVGARALTYLDNRLTTPWTDMTVQIGPNGTLDITNHTLDTPIQQGTARWSAVYDEYKHQGVAGYTPHANPILYNFSNTANNADNVIPESAHLMAPPSERYVQLTESKYWNNQTRDFKANEYITFDVRYFTQVIQTTVNGLQISPWSDATVQFTEHYNGYAQSQKTTLPLNSAGNGSFVTMENTGLVIYASRHQYETRPVDMSSVLGTIEVKTAATYYLPYFSITSRAIAHGQDFGCPPDFIIQIGKTKVNIEATYTPEGYVLNPVNVMPGTYLFGVLNSTSPITPTVECSGCGDAAHCESHAKHVYINAYLDYNKIYTLEYMDSGDENNPYPVLTYTGYNRESTSKLNQYFTQFPQNYQSVSVSDETNIVVEYATETPNASITVNGKIYDASGKDVTANYNLKDIFSFTQNDIAVTNNQRVAYAAGEEVFITSTLNAPIKHQTFPVTLTVTLNDGADTLPPMQIIYYNGSSAASLHAKLAAAPADPESRKSYLVSAGILEAVKNEDGTFTVEVPYYNTGNDEDGYHLYINGALQSDTYMLKNTWAQTLVWGAAPNEIGRVWAQNYNGPSFTATANGHMTFTARASEQETGNVPQDIAINLYTVSIYTNTDFKQVLPYTIKDEYGDDVSNTYIHINRKVELLNSADGHEFIVVKGQHLSVEAQSEESTDSTFAPIWEGTVIDKTSILLNYNTITVTADDNLTPSLNGVKYPETKTFITGYAFNQASMVSLGTEVYVDATGAVTSSQTVKELFTTVKIQGETNSEFSLVATEYNPDGYHKIRDIDILQGVYYVYIVDNTDANAALMDTEFFAIEDKAIGISSTHIPGLGTPYLIKCAQGVKYDMLLSENGDDFIFAASSKQQFSVHSSSNIYVFENIPTGLYEIHSNGMQYVFSLENIVSIEGSYTSMPDVNSGLILIHPERQVTQTSGVTFLKWNRDVINPTSNVSYDSNGSIVNMTAVPNANTLSDNHIEAEWAFIMTGKTLAHAVSNDSGNNDNNPDSELIKLQVSDKYYIVRTFVNGERKTPSFSSRPVMVNGKYITIKDGQSVDKIPATQFPEVSAMVSAHGGLYEYSDTGLDSIVYADGVFNVYYYTVEFAVEDRSKAYGKIQGEDLCADENVNGPVEVLRNTMVTSKVSDAQLTLSFDDIDSHNRTALVVFVPDANPEFGSWQRWNKKDGSVDFESTPNMSSPITTPTKLVASFLSSIDPHTVTLENMAGRDFTTLVTDIYGNQHWALPSIGITGGLYGSVFGEKEDDCLTNPTLSDVISSQFNHGEQGMLSVQVHDDIVIDHYSEQTQIKIKLTGTKAKNGGHIVQLFAVDVPHEPYDEKITTAGSDTVTFNCFPGEYIIKVNGIPISQNISYETFSETIRSSTIPAFYTNSNGVIKCFEHYVMLRPYINRWSLSCESLGGEMEMSGLKSQQYKAVVTYYYDCPVCGVVTQTAYEPGYSYTCECGRKVYMTHSTLKTPRITEDLHYRVYADAMEVYIPTANIELEVPMVYDVTVLSVLDSKPMQPFAEAAVQLTYIDEDGKEETLYKMFNNGKAVFQVPIGCTYRIDGISMSKFAPDILLTNGISTTYASYTKPASYSGDTQATYYALYYTVTAIAGNGIGVVCVTDAEQASNVIHTSRISSVFQYNVGAHVYAEASSGYIPVHVYVNRDGKPYAGRTVFLSTSSSENTKSYQLTWDKDLQCYRHSYVYGAANGTTYYVWTDGEYVGTTKTDAVVYSQQSIVVKPTAGTVAWRGNCKAGNSSLTDHANVDMHFVNVTHTITETASISSATTPSATVNYYTITVRGDSGFFPPTAGIDTMPFHSDVNGVYLEGTEIKLSSILKQTDYDEGIYTEGIELYLDNVPFTGQTVQFVSQAFGNETPVTYPAYETAPGVYAAINGLPAGKTYDVFVTSIGYSNKVGSFSIASARTYEWNRWADYCMVCIKCEIHGNCCIDANCCDSNLKCNNCLPYGSTNPRCCENGSHVWSGPTGGHNCLSAFKQDPAIEPTAQSPHFVTMTQPLNLIATSKSRDIFTITGDTSFNFYVLQLNGDAGINTIIANGTTYTPAKDISAHGNSSKTWLSTFSDHELFTTVIVPENADTSLNVTIKEPVKNHAEAKTAITITLTRNGFPYTGQSVKIGGHVATHQGNGVYTTTYSQFVGGNRYEVLIANRHAGWVYLESYRSYKWYQWHDGTDWDEMHYCEVHQTVHNVSDCLTHLNNGQNNAANRVNAQDQFIELYARTEFIDEFHVYLDVNQPGGPDPYEPHDEDNPEYDPDDPEKDPTDSDFNEDENPGDQPNPEYDPDYTPEPNPDYDPVNPDPPVDPSDNPDDFDPTDPDDGYYEDAPIKYFTLTINTRLDAAVTTAFPIKFTNLTTGEVTYHKVNSAGSLVITLQDGDKYQIATITELIDRNNDGKITADDISGALNSQTYTTVSTGAINGKPEQFTIDFWSLTVDVYSDNVHELPSTGKTLNNTNTQFAQPVNVDGRVVSNKRTIKAYLSGESYAVNARPVYNAEFKNHSSGVMTKPTTIRVDFYSMTLNHRGGFTSLSIEYPNTTVLAKAETPYGATSTATVVVYALKGTRIRINATLADNNEWKNWTGAMTLSNQHTGYITMNVKMKETAHATTFYTVKYYLHDKHGNWYEKSDDSYTKDKILIDNTNWTNVTVPGDNNKYENFKGYQTVYYAPNGTLSDCPNTPIDVVVNDSQVGGQSFVKFYYTRDGSTDGGTPGIVGEKENVKITYVLNDGTYNGSKSNYSETHYKGTDITLITPVPPAGTEFLGWFIQNENNERAFIGMVGTAGSHYLLTRDTVVYAAYTPPHDLGITANDIFGTIKIDSQFMTSATIVNHNRLSIIPDNHIDAIMEVINVNSGAVVTTATIKDVVVPGNGTQLVWATVNTSGWSKSTTYQIRWRLSFTSSIAQLYEDTHTNNNTSYLNTFKPDQLSAVVNTARPGYSTARPQEYNKNATAPNTANTFFSWEYWTWNATSQKFNKISSNDNLNITLILKPENENGLRTYTTGAYGIRNYTTRSGYGLSIHTTFADTYSLPVPQSAITAQSTIGTLQGIMTFPEFNYGHTTGKYATITATRQGNYYALRLPTYTDYESADANDKVAHYTPMWLPGTNSNPELYTPVSYFGGLWTPLGELTAVVKQGQYTSKASMDNISVYTNTITIKGSMYDDIYITQ